MSVVKRLQSLNLPSEALITLTYEQGADVFHFNDTEIDTAISETSVVESLSSLIANSKLDVRNRWAGNILQHLRDQDYLEDYERGSYEFAEYIADTIRQNFYDVELIDYSTEKYDHKRGYTTLTAEVTVPYSNFAQVEPDIDGWKVSVVTDVGTVSFDA